MTPQEAKQLLRAELKRRGLGYEKLSGKTIGFQDLARGSAVFVHVHGWKPNPEWTELQQFAKRHGFIIKA